MNTLSYSARGAVTFFSDPNIFPENQPWCWDLVVFFLVTLGIVIRLGISSQMDASGDFYFVCESLKYRFN